MRLETSRKFGTYQSKYIASHSKNYNLKSLKYSGLFMNR